MRSIIIFIGSFGYTGFFPVARATFASLVFILIYLYVPGGEVLAHPYVLIATLILSIPISSSMERRYGHDAGCIVIDEVVGMQVILCGAETTVTGVFVAFFIFRVFDVIKPFPAGRAQRLPGGWGIVGDDVMAAIYSRLVLAGIALIYPGIGQFLF